MVHYVWLRPHAIAEGQPSVDVYLSQEHCLFLDDRCVPDSLLANVGSIMLEREVAGGLPEETYQDTGSRGPLSNAGEPMLPHSTISVNEDTSRWVTGAGAPLATEADKVEPIPSHLAKQSEDPGYMRGAARTSRDAEVRLVADGAAIRPVETSGGIYSFVVPRNVRSVSLESRFAMQTDAVPPQKADTSRRG